MRLDECQIANSLIDKCDQGKLTNSRLIGQVASRGSLKTGLSATTTRYGVNLPKTRASCNRSMQHHLIS